MVRVGQVGQFGWRPTGDRIVYTAQGEPRGSQIFVRYMDAEGATTQVTRVEKAPTNVTWSPDGTRLAFTMNVEAKVVLPDPPNPRFLIPGHVGPGPAMAGPCVYNALAGT